MISYSILYTLKLYLFIYWCIYLLGVELLGVFERELARHEKSRQELANAEKLFDLPITMYPELLKVQKEMSGLRMIYELYEGLKVSISPKAKDSSSPKGM